MNALELYRLGRRLTKIGERAMASSGPAPARLPSGVRVILEDIGAYPSSTIGEIATRTGFPQSHVSASVARFRERGAIETAVDPDDRRRTLVRLHPDFLRTMTERGAVPVDEALAEALVVSDARNVAELVSMLESLADQLLQREDDRLPPTAPRAARRASRAGAVSRRSVRAGEGAPGW
jgi:DNA-binding MarR family transcriptional regulator